MSAKFFVRLHGNNNTWEDLAGNTWRYNGAARGTGEGRFAGGQSLHFLGNNGQLYLQNKYNTEELRSSDAFTISFWVKPISLGSGAYITIRNTSPFVEVDISAIGFGWYVPSSTGSDYDTVQVVEFEKYILGEWQHWAVCGDGQKCKVFFNGVEILSFDFVSRDIPLMIAASKTGAWWKSVYIDSRVGDEWYIDDICFINECLWTKDFTPPTDYLELPKKIFLSNGLVYGIDTNDAFNKLADSFVDEDDATKLDVLNLVSPVISPVIEELYTLNMPINALIGKMDSSAPRCDIVAVPQNETVLPNNMTSIPLNSKIKLVGIDASVSDGATLTCAITKDGSTYQVWNNILSRWEDINIDNIATDGMNYKDIAVIPEDAWRDYNCTELGFAFYLGANNASDVVVVKSVVINYTT